MIFIKKKRFLSLLAAICVLIAILTSLTIWKTNSVTKLKTNQTYMLDNKQTGGDPPSYIKFLDNSRYVAIPLQNLDEDSDQIVGVTFIQGTYSQRHNRYILGNNTKETSLVFSNYQDFEKGDYTLQHKKVSPQEKNYIFVGNYIKKEHGAFCYKWAIKINNADKPDRYKSKFVRLKKSKLDIPITEKEFIRKYHKKQ
ncbi:hypothetical protein LFYK43_04750 [Ligilactobacillus salitolerans]|uniref:Uncharacterized protein n=1 Tax=Ligilactobacillus salitolerans TaxID=1808352 RepID=A0A401IR65_9LACO|nr:hypothetical protein [Ligilactobacillus salitolerans]GBG94016.1 hypothetical protein LFYK43_04750 [Ligilactobacillus salitolerans]